MKIIFSETAGKKCRLFIGILLLGIVLWNIFGFILNSEYISVFAAAAKVDNAEVKSRLLMEAMDRVGVCAAEQAAQVWADGLKMRSAAMQYAVMGSALKKEYAKQRESSSPNWVTGISSPWIDSYKITRSIHQDKGTVFQLRFLTKTSTGSAGEYDAALLAEQENGFWRITKINADPELYPYTGYQPISN